jgi:hypothetical protein
MWKNTVKPSGRSFNSVQSFGLIKSSSPSCRPSERREFFSSTSILDQIYSSAYQTTTIQAPRRMRIQLSMECARHQRFILCLYQDHQRRSPYVYSNLADKEGFRWHRSEKPIGSKDHALHSRPAQVSSNAQNTVLYTGSSRGSKMAICGKGTCKVV